MSQTPKDKTGQIEFPRMGVIVKTLEDRMGNTLYDQLGGEARLREINLEDRILAFRKE